MSNVNHHRLTDEERHKEAKREGVVRATPPQRSLFDLSPIPGYIIPPDGEEGNGPATYHDHAAAEAEAIGGRFSQEERYQMAATSPPPRIEGASPFTDPINAVLNSAPARVCDDPGFDPALWQAPVVGEPGEIEASLAALDLPAIEAAVDAVKAEGKLPTKREVLLRLPKAVSLRELKRAYAHNELRQKQAVAGDEVERIEREQEWLREQIGRLEHEP